MRRIVSISLNVLQDYFRANQRARSVDYEKVFHGKHCGGLIILSNKDRQVTMKLESKNVLFLFSFTSFIFFA